MSKPVTLESYTAAVSRFNAKHPVICLTLDTPIAFAVIGAIQLALRHPQFPAHSKGLLTNIVRDMAQAFAEEPVLVAHIEQGFDPRYDVEADEPSKEGNASFN